MKQIRVLVAEDHETVRQGLKLLIDSQPDMNVIAEAGDGPAAVEATAAHQPDVVVMDISMPHMNGLAATQIIRARHAATAVIALSRYRDEAYVRELRAAGAQGYVLKQSASGELLAAIRAGARGESYFDASLTATAAAAGVHRAEASNSRITDRETQVLRRMALGESNKEIASALEVSVKTVEVHKANAMRKLGLGGRIDVVKYAILQGWLREP